MKKETKLILQNIAQIQIKALESLEQNPEGVDYLHFELLGINDLDIDILSVIRDRIQFWKNLESNPSLILTLNEYQLGIVMHILYSMEEEWLQLGETNAYFTIDAATGINDTWKILDSMYKRFHPEVVNFLKF
jgi:hypothetical protein